MALSAGNGIPTAIPAILERSFGREMGLLGMPTSDATMHFGISHAGNRGLQPFGCIVIHRFRSLGLGLGADLTGASVPTRLPCGGSMDKQ